MMLERVEECPDITGAYKYPKKRYHMLKEIEPEPPSESDALEVKKILLSLFSS